jgi:hypothetical protein
MKARIRKFSIKTLAVIGTGTIGLFGLALPTKATLVYDESVSGDLSNDRFNPTPIPVLRDGRNQISFKINNPTTGLPASRDLEYFTVTVPTGFALTRLLLDNYRATSTGGGLATDRISFIALQAGSVFTELPQPRDPNGNLVSTDPTKLLGYALIGTRDAADEQIGKPSEGVVIASGEDVLPALGLTAGRPSQPNGSVFPPPIGFIPPLGSGNYVFWVQQTAQGQPEVILDLVISPVPEPTSAVAVAAVGGLGLLLRRNRR